MPLSAAQRLKFRLLAHGIVISRAARDRLDDLRGDRKLSPADFASTSGMILRLEDQVWVNAPFEIAEGGSSADLRSVLQASTSGFVVTGGGLESEASVWLPPRYHDRALGSGRLVNHFAYTHGDRVRLSPLRGCAMRCQFCNVPYDDPYGTKPLAPLLEALGIALADPLQPARHVLISGGTPVPRDVPFLGETYERVLRESAGRPVDIMMVPVPGLFDLQRLKALGVNELSINIELFNPVASRKLMPQKHAQGVGCYLDFIEAASEELGPGTVRSMLMVGLEPVEDTLSGVRAILQAGGVPVLSPFRPDAATPLRAERPMPAEELETVFLAAVELASAAGVALGPSCPPCTHNTLTLVPAELEDSAYPHPPPRLV